MAFCYKTENYVIPGIELVLEKKLTVPEFLHNTYKYVNILDSEKTAATSLMDVSELVTRKIFIQPKTQ